MLGIERAVARGIEPEALAQEFLQEYFYQEQTVIPINPFQMLTDHGVPFVFRSFEKYEGVYIPARDNEDVAVVGINLKRPITRQRYTAAHELCHHIKDSRKSYIVCDAGSNAAIETYAEKFAAELLMPTDLLAQQIAHYQKNGYVTFEDVLLIAHFFGVSFRACLNCCAYKMHVIAGDTSKRAFDKQTKKFKPDKRRAELGLDNIVLFEGLFRALERNFYTSKYDSVRNIFQNEYVYHDSRFEGTEIDRETASAIVADIRLNKQDSKYCTSEYKNIIEIAGHSIMYSSVFDMVYKEKINIYDIFILIKKLFSCAPNLDYDIIRKGDTLVIGAKFETTTHSGIMTELRKIDPLVRDLDENRATLDMAIYIEKIAVIHHKLTVIHPFPDGNGRVTRAFMNLQLMRKTIPPIYFHPDKMDSYASIKSAYLSALSIADQFHAYSRLYEIIFQSILTSHSELTSFPVL